MVIITIISFRASPVQINTKLLSLAIIWVGLVPGLIFIMGSSRSLVPFFPLVGLFYAVFYGLPTFLLPLSTKLGEPITNYGVDLVTTIDNQVLVVVLAALLVMVMSFFLAKSTVFKSLTGISVARRADPTHLTLLYWGLLFGHLAHRLVPALSDIPSIGQLLEPAGLVGICGLYVHWRRGILPRYQTIFLFFLILPIEFYLRIRFLLITDILLFSIFFCLILWRERQFKVISFIVVFVLFMLTFYGSSTTVRNAYDNAFDKIMMSISVYKGLMIDGKKIIYAENGRRSFGDEGRFGALARRTGHLWIFHYVYQVTPDDVPYWDGESYRPLLTAIIPRILYPDKPKEQTGAHFGFRYGFTKDINDRTSINLPWLTELQINFGVKGTILGMGLIGIFLAFMDQVFNAVRSSDAEFALGASILLPLVYPESNFSVMTGSLPVLVLSLVVIFWLVERYSVKAKLLINPR